MKAVITKSQLNRIKNFINETREIPKANVLKEEKKYTDAQMRAFDKDKNGIPFQDKDWEMMDESDCGCGEDKDDTRYMFFSNLEQMMRQARMLLQMDEDMLEDLLNNGHDWAADHIAEAKNNMDQVFDFIMNEMNGEGEDADWDSEEEKEMVYEAMSFKKKDQILEGTYQGRKVTLNKPFLTPDGPKKRSVYVKNAKGNVVKVNFGDPNMRIKKNIPSHRKSFRARHKCETANDKTSARYWSCKAW